jgi:histone-lysine N-methyltransferase SETMAR
MPTPNTAVYAVDKLHALKFEMLKHPPYSPDLAPSDFHLFGLMKEHLWGQKFADDEIMAAVQSSLKAKATPRSFFLEGICKLVDRWTKCVSKQEVYVEK